ncbi:HET domain-containing protein [Colletotrichum asianum]|uniref:HET domain-containing protein n=1 Tax=Colletotrichum asianum TaxID=702518 RepID=A0A8H3W715_9PEZI|nr:HET domain-containing protein [Colletotrichum asianum]
MAALKAGRQQRKLYHEQQERLEQEGRHRSQYPPKLHFRDRFHAEGRSSASELVQKALQNGLDPNTLWTFEDIIDPNPTTAPNRYAYTWQRWNTPLHLALLCFDYESARVILHHGGDPNIYNGEGRTAIHEAIKRQNLEGVRFLIRHGADPDRASQDGLVPLHAALYDGDEETFFVLLEEGATLEAAAYYEWSITDLALLASEKSILERLMSDEYRQLPTPLMRFVGASSRPMSQDMAILAKRILVVVSSNQVLPEKALYETYQHLYSRLNISRNQRWEMDAVNDLVDNIMDSLHSVSQIPRLALGESFCPECLEIQKFIERFSRDRAAAKYEAYGKVAGFHTNKQELDDCALSGCSVCLTISDKFRELDEKGESGQNHELSPIALNLLPQPEYLIEEALDPRRINSFTAQVGDSKSLRANFDLRPYDTGFETHQEDPLSRCDDTSTGSPKALSVAKQWLQICKTSPKHSFCRDTYGPSGTCSTLPTRVLCVCSEDREPFLFEGNGLKEPYCILSYCWGHAGNCITTRKNFAQRTQSIPLATLPTLLRQAVIATRTLGYEYIWIDALCIIQDDPDDWAREAAVMHDRYSQADLTITSLVAADSMDSLFEPRLRRTARPIPLNIILPKKYRHPFNERIFEFAAYPDYHKYPECVVKGPVHQRAWTLQEHLMSTRVVYFGPGILHWECLCSYRLEPHPDALCIELAHSELDERRRLKAAVKTLQRQELSHQINAPPIEVWQLQVEEFTRRKLTKHSDRIPAFLAISKVLCKAGGDEFAGGLWTSKQLIPSMCWRLERADEPDMGGPSWTWGSRSGEVSYQLLRHPGKMTPKSSIVSVDINTDRSHRNTSGSITLRGVLSAREPNESGITEWFDYASEYRAKACHFEMLESGKTSPRPPSTGIQPFYRFPEKHNVSLLVMPVDDDEDFRNATVFRRVGIAKKAEIEYMASNKNEYDTRARRRDVEDYEMERVIVLV